MRSKGFTFIEVLVVITIISVLTLVGVTNFRVANQKSKDGRRQGDLEQIKAALEIYRTDQGGYPLAITFGAVLAAGGSTYMEKVPNDPLSSYSYYYSSDGLTYTLCAQLEINTTGSCSGAGASACGTGNSCNYQINNPL